MRIATLVIGLILSVGLFIQSSLVYSLAGVADRQESEGSGALGVMMAFVWLVASALVIAVPRVSMILFALAALFGFAGASDYPDLWIWGSISLGLALFSYLGYRGKRREQAKQAVLLDAANAVQAALAKPAARNVPAAVPATAAQRFCPQCGAPNAATARFCSSCGERLDDDQPQALAV